MLNHYLFSHNKLLTALQSRCMSHDVFLCVCFFLTELLSSNKKYGVKQRQYKLFAGEFGCFDTYQAHHSYLFSGLFLWFGFVV